MYFNDYYAETYLDLLNPSHYGELSSILNRYDERNVNRLHLLRHYNLAENPISHIVRSRYAYDQIKHLVPTHLNLKIYTLIMLYPGLTDICDLKSLALVHEKRSYVYIDFPLDIKIDDAVSELHTMLYKLKLTPIMINFERYQYFFSKEFVDKMLHVPNAIYHINISNISEKNTAALIKRLHKSDKKIIFGTGSKFDAGLYQNINYYIKLLKETLGERPYKRFMYKYGTMFK